MRDNGNAQRIGGARRAEGNPGGYNERVTGTCKSFVTGCQRGTVGHFLEIMDIFDHDAMQAPAQAQAPRRLDTGGERQDRDHGPLACRPECS